MKQFVYEKIIIGGIYVCGSNADSIKVYYSNILPIDIKL